MARPVPISKLAQDLGINPRKWFGIPKPPKPSKGISQRKIDNFIGEIGQVRGPAGYIREKSHDKRTVKSVQRITQELTRTASPKEIGRELGISYQRWTAIRKSIEKGEAYGPEFREALKQATAGVSPDHELKESPNGSIFDFFKDEGVLEKLKITWGKDITPGGFMDLDEAGEWWEKIGGGMEYFVITSRTDKKTGRKMYHVIDIRTPSEIKSKGKLKNIIRAREIIEKEYGKK